MEEFNEAINAKWKQLKANFIQQYSRCLMFRE